MSRLDALGGKHSPHAFLKGQTDTRGPWPSPPQGDTANARGGKIARAFAALEGRKAFIPYLTAGDPSLKYTGRYLDALESAGATVIELGVPFSDPVADGPVNQRAAERALKAGTNLDGILNLIRRRRSAVPVLLFTYVNPVLSLGWRRFAERAAEAGAAGALIVDLPPEEAQEYRQAMHRCDLDTVFLASPTTSDKRLRLVDQSSTGFVYYVSRLGVTGVSAKLSKDLSSELKRVRRSVKNPLAVGFGISTPEQARAAGQGADGVVVGSALVRLIEEKGPEGAAKAIKRLATSMVEALRC